MLRIDEAFRRLRRQRRKALIPFVVGGDPSLEATKQVIVALADAGADVIEVGIPFSDPLADGPVIQRASYRALQRGATPHAVVQMLSEVTDTIAAPVVVLSYWNPILQYGSRIGTEPRAFLRALRQAGVSGVIVPDLPLEEAQAFQRDARLEGIAMIALASPTSPPARLRAIARASTGFIYYVSVTGTTGVRKQLASEWRHGVRQLKLVTTKPVCVGFGISTPAQAAMVARGADGVIIGSALVGAIGAHRGSHASLARRARTWLKPFRRVV